MFKSIDKLYCTMLEEKVFKKDNESFPYRTLTILLNGKTQDFTLHKDCPSLGFVQGEYYIDITLVNGKIRVTNLQKEIKEVSK